MDTYGRRMAYRSAARAAFYGNELLEEKEKTENFKVYHAHGYVIHSENLTTGDEVWERNSAFSEVFFDFEEAKGYLLKKFNKGVADIYRRDEIFASEPISERDINKQSSLWRREYIEEYIDYSLVISEISPENGADDERVDFTKPRKIDWYLRYTGEVQTRYFTFGDEEYECRESDLLPQAGSKFKVGDLVEYTDREYRRDYPGIYVVLTPPTRPSDKRTPWVNEYELLDIDDESLSSNGTVNGVTVHEADLKLADDESIRRCSYREPLLALQKVINGEAKLSDEIKEKILGGEVLFNAQPSWRDFIELKKQTE